MRFFSSSFKTAVVSSLPDHTRPHLSSVCLFTFSNLLTPALSLSPSLPPPLWLPLLPCLPFLFLSLIFWLPSPTSLLSNFASFFFPNFASFFFFGWRELICRPCLCCSRTQTGFLQERMCTADFRQCSERSSYYLFGASSHQRLE